MLPSLEETWNEHQHLRQLLDVCERSPAEELHARLEQLVSVMATYQPHKEALYDAARQVFGAAGDQTGQSLVEILRNNLVVAVGAVKMLRRYTDPSRARQRLRMVAASLRSILDSDERVVLPLFQRGGAAGRSGGHGRQERI